MSDTNQKSLSQRGLPSRVYPNTYGPDRSSEYGEKITQPLYGDRQQTLSDEGSYFYSQHPTIDAATTIAGHAAPVLADLYTKPFLVIRNTDAITSRKRMYLDYILLTVITPGTGGTSDNWAAECDTGADRYSSGTVITLTTVNPNMQSTTTSVGTMRAGPFVAAAATANQRKMGSGVFRPTIAVTGDQYLFVFGATPMALGAAVATAHSKHIVPLAPVILGPTDMFLLHLYAPSQSAATVLKVQAAHWER